MGQLVILVSIGVYWEYVVPGELGGLTDEQAEELQLPRRALMRLKRCLSLGERLD